MYLLSNAKYTANVYLTQQFSQIISHFSTLHLHVYMRFWSVHKHILIACSHFLLTMELLYIKRFQFASAELFTRPYSYFLNKCDTVQFVWVKQSTYITTQWVNRFENHHFLSYFYSRETAIHPSPAQNLCVVYQVVPKEKSY